MHSMMNEERLDSRCFHKRAISTPKEKGSRKKTPDLHKFNYPQLKFSSVSQIFLYAFATLGFIYLFA